MQQQKIKWAMDYKTHKSKRYSTKATTATTALSLRSKGYLM